MSDGKNNNKRRVIIGAVSSLLIAGIIALIVVLTTRPKNIEVTESAAVESLPSLIKAVTIGDGAIAVEYTELLEDKSSVFYYVALSDLDASGIQAALNFENPALFFVPEVGSMESSLRIGLVNEITFPYQLPDSYLPGDYNGLILSESDSSDDPNAFKEPFIIIDASQNIASTTMKDNTMEDSSMKDSTMEDSSMKDSTMEDSSMKDNNMEDNNIDASMVKPQVLVGDIDGSGSYNIGGSITIDTVMDLKGGEIVDVARLRFDVQPVSAPGPYLYLSKRPFSETRDANLNEEDVWIPIEGVENGSFTKGGMFEQILDEIGNVQDLKEYEGGSFIIWCRPFGVWLGGGTIEASN